MPLFVAVIIRLCISFFSPASGSAGQKTTEVSISDLQLYPVMSVRLFFRLVVIAAPDGQL